MSTARVSTFVAILAGLVLAPAPMLAQDRRGPDQDNQAQGGRRRPPRDQGARSGDNAPRGDAGQGDRGSQRREAGPRREAVPRAEGGSRNDDRDRDQRRRVQPNRGGRDDRGRDDWRDDRGREREWRNGGRYSPPPRVHRNYSRPTRVYAVPYGYRPRGYRPGWSLNLYFGRPYGYSYPGYYSRGGGYGYGYYAIPSGFAYGSLRIVDAPRHAQVFVDGYYAGIVDDYDGVFQRLNLESGRHVVEIDVYAGAPPLEYDVWVEPGRTVTIHARP